MALTILEKSRLENHIAHLKEIYPTLLDENTIVNLKKRVLETGTDASLLTREITSLYKGNTNAMEAFLMKYQVSPKDKAQVVENTKQEVKSSLNMQDITDFRKDGKDYIKITYQDGRVQIIENRTGKDSKKIFEDVQKIKALNNLDGRQNAEQAFKELLKDYIEVDLQNPVFTNQEKYSLQDQTKIQFVQAMFPTKQVFASPEHDIYIVKGNPDLTVEVVEKDGHFELKQLEESTYGVKKEKEQVETLDVPEENTIEHPNDIVYEYSIEDIERATNGMSEEEIVMYLRSLGKNPSQITMIVLELEKRKAERIEKKPELEKPKQMVLTNPNKPTSGFINALTLAFLVGMVGGCIFFVALNILLRYV